ncbi:hypothetical protein [Pedobacter xixiisoli]|uniref:Uncharacterized protein n=1 Tax=Pedobacter xixiisoli TaxID=1476464 RepID=A0A286A8V7_9SPHI|nr:hypothetical protein [Pedobacter xixiisoli]SOD18346.1 hypothetical protein SAMN06297358_2953 [Pedobacter xixiisoli]
MIKEKTLLKFGIVLAICFAVHISIGLFSSLIVNNFILKTQLANFTIYDGYADLSMLLAYISMSALLVFNKIKGNALLIALGAFAVILVSKVFVIDIVEHYIRFYVKTQQNGGYSLYSFRNELTKQWDRLLFEFSNLGQFLSFLLWLFVALLAICYLSLWAKKVKFKTT